MSSGGNAARKQIATENVERVRQWYAENTGEQIDCANALGLSVPQVARSLKIIKTGVAYTPTGMARVGRTNAERMALHVNHLEAQRAHLDTLRTGKGFPCRFTAARECGCCA